MNRPPLDCGILTSAAVAANQMPAEAALLAHCIVDPSRIERLDEMMLTPPTISLLNIIEHFGALVQTVGLADLVMRVYDPAEDDVAVLKLDKPVVHHIDVYEQALLVDSIRVVELTAIGSFETVVAMLRGRLKPKRPKTATPARPAWERDLAIAQQAAS